MEHFLIVVNRHKDKNLETAGFIKKYLEAHHKECRICEREEESGQAADLVNADCVLVLGGDGTLLQAAGDMMDRDIPLLGINMGTLGYLAEVEKNGVEDALERLLAGEFEVEQRMMLKGRILRGKAHENGSPESKKPFQSAEAEPFPKEQAYALNDITITRRGSLQIIKYQLYVNDMFLNSYDGDGVIVATPTGSTGYNMSAGGPVVEPKAELILITPVCPHTLNTRSIILSAADKIVVEVAPGREDNVQQVEVSFDGSHQLALYTGDRVVIEKADRTTGIIKLNKVSFLSVLHKKMSD